MRVPLPFAWPYAAVFWLAFFWVFAPEWGVIKRAGGRTAEDDAGSLAVILIGNQMAMLLGFGAAWLARAATFSAHRLPAFWSGIAVMLCGALLRRHCFRVLGAFFNGAVTVREDHRVIDSGAYRWIRHPSYTGGMAIFLGIGIALANWVSLACLTVIPIAAYSYRILVEERALMLRIGEPYRDYARRTKRLIPFVL